MCARIRIATFLLSLVFLFPVGRSQSTPGITAAVAGGVHAAVTAENTARPANEMVLDAPGRVFTAGTSLLGIESIRTHATGGQRYQGSEVCSTFMDDSSRWNSVIPHKGFVISGAPRLQSQLLASDFTADATVVVSQPIFNNASIAATAANTARGTNQLIVYTPAFGASTQTNIYGYEITVENGIVTQTGGNDSPIPTDGYVLSGHGSSDAWLVANAIIGSRITLNELKITITTNGASYLYQAASTVNRTKAHIQNSLKQLVNAPLDLAETLIAQAEIELKEATELEPSDKPKAVFLANEAINTANTAYNYTLPSRVAEAHATWYRPVETNLKQVRETLDRMQNGGFNELYLEIWFEGYTIYPSATMAGNNMTSQNPAFAGFDPLKAFAFEAKKRDIAVYAWIDGFMLGTNFTGPVLQAHPEWAAATRDQVGNAQPAPAPSTGFFWMDIANPRVQQFMLALTKEMVQQYGLAGVDLDYTRFPAEANWQQSFSFSNYARQAYKDYSGIDPYTLNADAQSAAWEAWKAWLSDQEDQFVQDEYQSMKGISRQIVVSITPEAGPETTEIGRWSQYLDVVIPQASNLGAVPPLVQQVESQLAPGYLIYAGIYPFYHRESPVMTVSEVLSGHDLVSGTNIFAFGGADEPAIAALRQGPWRNPAISPGLHPISATRAQLAALSDDVLTVYVPRHVMNIKTADDVLSRLAELEWALSSPEANLNQVQEELANLSNFVQHATCESRMDPIVSSRLQGLLTYLEKLITYSVTKGIK